jgi:hypothetical protein
MTERAAAMVVCARGRKGQDRQGSFDDNELSFA